MQFKDSECYIFRRHSYFSNFIPNFSDTNIQVCVTIYRYTSSNISDVFYVLNFEQHLVFERDIIYHHIIRKSTDYVYGIWQQKKLSIKKFQHKINWEEKW